MRTRVSQPDLQTSPRGRLNALRWYTAQALLALFLLIGTSAASQAACTAGYTVTVDMGGSSGPVPFNPSTAGGQALNDGNDENDAVYEGGLYTTCGADNSLRPMDATTDFPNHTSATVTGSNGGQYRFNPSEIAYLITGAPEYIYTIEVVSPPTSGTTDTVTLYYRSPFCYVYSDVCFTFFADYGPTNKSATITLTNVPGSTSAPTASIAVSPTSFTATGTSTVTVTLTNPNVSTALSGVADTVTLPSGVTVASTPASSTTCGGALAATAGASSIALSGGSLSASAACTFQTNVTSSVAGTYSIPTGTPSATGAGAGTAGASASLTVNAASAPTIDAALSPTTITTAQTSTLTLTITNTNASTALSGLAVAAAALPANLTGSSASTTCSGGTANYNSGTRQLSLSGASLAAGTSSSCTVSLTVSSTTAGSYSYTTGAVSSSSPATTGTTATTPAALTVNATVPGAPTIGTATAGDGQATVTFTAPASNGGSAITSDTVTSSPPGGTATGAASPITVTGLTNGTAYTFTVEATNGVGTGAASAASNSVTPKAPQQITFNNPGTQNFGTTPTLSATSNSGLTVSFTSATTAVCTITSGGALTFVTAGSCTINADQAGNSFTLAAPQVPQTFTVAPVLPGAPNIGSATAGDGQATVTFTAPASNGGSAIASYTVTSSPGGFSSTGAASPITVTGLINGTAYTFTVEATNGVGTGPASAASNSVTPRSAQTITFNNPGSQTFGTTPTLSATAPGGTVTFSSATTAVCTITSGGLLTFLTGGSCTINADQAGNGTYLAAPQATQTFTVNAIAPGAPTIGTATAGDAQASVTFTAPASTGGSVITGYTVTSSPPGGTANGASSPIIVSGLTNGTAYTFTVTADNVAGTGASSAASNSVTPKGAQTITFANPGSQSFGTTPTLSATAPGGTVTFTSTTTAVCTITSGGALTFLTTGSCTINADQAGNAAYSAATQVSQSFSVNAVAPAAPTIGTATGGNAQATVTFTGPGTTGGAPVLDYTVTSSPGGISATGTSSPITVTGLLNGTAYTFTVTARNSAGSGAASTASNSVTPVAIIATTTTLASSAASALKGQGVTLTATVSPAPTGGTVTFTDGATVLCSAVAHSGGVATCAATFASGGAHNVVASYSGSGTHGASSSAALALTVTDQTQQTAETVATFISQRNTLISTNAFDEMREIDRLNEFDNGPGSGGGSTFTEGQTAASPSAGASHLGMSDTPEIANMLASQIAGISNGKKALRGDSQGFADQMQLGLANQDATTPRATGGPLSFSGSGDDTSLRFGFATSLSAIMKNEAAKDAEKLKGAGAAGLAFGADKTPQQKAAAQTFDIWVEGRYTGLTNSALDGHFGIFTLGADYVVNRSLLVGAYVQYDDMSQTNDTRRTKAESRGWMAGPYMTMRLTDHLFWQARGAWGKSDVDVSPFQTYTDSFETTRWMTSSKLSGRWQMGPWTFSPQASVSYLSDTSDAYRDTFGALIPKVKSELGQAKVGPEVGYSMKTVNGIILEPRGKLELVWDFADDVSAQGLNLVVDEATSMGDVRGRAEVGFRAMTPGGVSLDLSGAYDGIGASGTDAITGRAMVRVPLN